MHFTTTPPLLSADHPRTDPGEDLLGYAPFAKMLAHSVLRGSPSEGLVVGIYGEWGLGKTTLLNFIEHFTRADAGDDEPIIVRFNPWWFSGREDLLRRFFKEFESAVLKARVRDTKVQKALLGGLEKLGDAVSGVPSAWIATAGKGVAALARLGQAPPDVAELRAPILKALGENVLRVIVLVDDIDRLLPSEMVDVFRLVRSVGDFANVHYVLAFDRDVVAKALTDECHTDGTRYLEKIIQAPFELPRPNRATLHALFTRRLHDVLAGTDDVLLDAQRWGDVFLNGVAPFLRTPRDVTRLLNSLAVVYPSVRNEVNPTDFVAIETLRIFAPDVYDVVRSNRSRFVGFRAAVRHLADENRKFHEQWISGVTRNAKAALALIVRLFPAVASALSKNNSSSSRDGTLRKERRIGTEQLFDLYFRYMLDHGLSRSAFVASLESPDDLGTVLQEIKAEPLDRHARLRWFLETLRDELEGGLRVESRQLLARLCGAGDAILLNGVAPVPFDLPDDLLLVFVVERVLQTMPANDRTDTLEAALDSAGVATVARIVFLLGAHHGRYGTPAIEEASVLAEPDLAALGTYARRRLAAAATDGSVWAAPGMSQLLSDWRMLGDDVVVREVVRKWTVTDANLGALLASATRIAPGGREVFDIDLVSDLLDLEETVTRARGILSSGTGVAKLHHSFQLLLDAYAATEVERNEEKVRRAVLDAILATMTATGWYPTAHSIRGQFRDYRVIVNKMLNEHVIGNVATELYMIRFKGLQLMRFDPRAKREFDVLSRLVTQMQKDFVQLGRVFLQLQDYLSKPLFSEGAVSLEELRRAALVLQPFSLSLGFDNGALPTTIELSERILDLSLDSLSEE